MSTKEEALRKAMEQKEEVRVRGEDLQQLVEEAVRKVIGGASPEEGAPRTIIPEGDPVSNDRRLQLEDGLFKETGHSLPWYRGINSIAVNIKMKIGEGKKGGVLFVSSTSGEGTTTICTNVAQALAKVSTGNVLLMDCNAQKPEIHKLFNTEAVPGLVEVLQGKISWEGAIRKSTIKNFYLLPFGESIPEPLSLLGSGGMEDLLKELKGHFDFIMMDTPPVLNSVEAEMIAPWVEAVILIIKAQVTRREVVLRAVERMIQYKDFMGAIFNQQEFIIPQYLYKRLK